MFTLNPIDPKLKDLLVREAHLRLSWAQITPIWTQKEADLRAIEAAKPAMWPIFSKQKRRDYEARHAEALQVAVVLREGVNVLDRVEAEVKKLITGELEVMLSAERPGYAEALATLRQRDDWLACVERFATGVHEFASQLGNARNLACSGYARKSNAYSQNAAQAFQLAVDAAQKIDEAAVSANKISDARTRAFVERGFKSLPLPKLEPTGFAAWVTRISTLPLAEAQTQFDLLSAATKKVQEAGLVELRADGEAADRHETAEVHRALFDRWEQFRAAVAPEIYPGDTGRIVAETEAMLNQGAAPAAAG